VSTEPTSAPSRVTTSSTLEIGGAKEEGSTETFDEAGFLQSIVGPVQAVKTAGGLLRITAIELYEQGLIVHWILKLARYLESLGGQSRAAVLSISERQRTDREIFGAIPHFIVRDDLGTSFAEEQTNWTGTTTLHGNSRFLPGLPASASMLEFEGANWKLKVDQLSTSSA
jgi:hypothetical protein